MEFSARQRALMLDLAREVMRRALAGEDPGGAGVRELAARAALAMPLGAHESAPSSAAAVRAEEGTFRPHGEIAGATPLPVSELSWDPLADAALVQPAGCFVTLHTLRGRRLRGCVGRLDAT